MAGCAPGITNALTNENALILVPITFRNLKSISVWGYLSKENEKMNKRRVFMSIWPLGGIEDQTVPSPNDSLKAI